MVCPNIVLFSNIMQEFIYAVRESAGIVQKKQQKIKSVIHPCQSWDLNTQPPEPHETP